jgi:hypothetical protein
MKLRLLHIAFLVSFLACYLEWGKGRWAFIAEVDYEIFAKKQLINFFHPVILAGFISQFIFLYGAIAKRPFRWITITALILAGLIVLLCLFVGVLSTNAKIILSTLPYLFFCLVYFRSTRQLYSTRN